MLWVIGMMIFGGSCIFGGMVRGQSVALRKSAGSQSIVGGYVAAVAGAMIGLVLIVT